MLSRSHRPDNNNVNFAIVFSFIGSGSIFQKRPLDGTQTAFAGVSSEQQPEADPFASHF